MPSSHCVYMGIWTLMIFYIYIYIFFFFRGFPGGTVVKNLPASAGDAGDMGLILESGRSPRVGNGNPLQCSCLENPMDRGAWQARVHGVTKESDTTE